jgi:hypothetical protein
LKPRELKRCQVPGCEADLYKLKCFNLRCEICDKHGHVSSIVLGGLEQRFCQQCNKFQPLGDFDGNNRGCREKLLRHNKRCAQLPPGLPRD